MAVNIDIRPPGIESSVTTGVDFSIALSELGGINHQVIRTGQNAQLRIQQGKEDDVSTKGNYVGEGQVYHKGDTGILIAESPYLTEDNMLKQAIEAHRQGRHFSTPNRSLYERFLQQAQEDASKNPKDRRAILIPSDQLFAISQTINPEVFAFLGLNQTYLDFVEQDSLTFYPESQGIIEEYRGTVPIQLWFSGLGGGFWSVLGSDILDLDFDLRVRGVREVVSTAGANEAQKNHAQGSELYSPEQLQNALKQLDLGGLETQLINQLRRK